MRRNQALCAKTACLCATNEVYAQIRDVQIAEDYLAAARQDPYQAVPLFRGFLFANNDVDGIWMFRRR